MHKVTTVEFTAALIKHGSWGYKTLGKHPSAMTLYLADDRTEGCIEWDIPALERTEEIGLWFEDGELLDYDGVMSLPREAVSLLRSFGFTVSDEFF